MQILNRNLAPEYQEIKHLEVQKAEQIVFPNGLKVFIVNAGSQEVCKAELIFKAGFYYQPQSLMASLSNSMTEFGTKKYSANDLSDELDFHGSYFDMQCGHDNASLSLITLNKHLQKTLPLFEELVKNPIFPESEIGIQIESKKQEFLIQSEKVNVLARRHFKPLLFGESHPYCDFANIQSFDSINSTSLCQFYNNHYNVDNAILVLAGNIQEKEIEAFRNVFGNEKWGSSNKIEQKTHANNPVKTRQNFICKENAIQSAIRIGRPTFSKNHPDFPSFFFTNCLLGGYFGSRLMANIREDKGFTYGIGSNQINLVNGGYFFISTEVGKDVTQAALNEIYFELDRLRNEPVEADEIETVRNYLMGQMLHNIEGPFALAETFKSLHEFNLGYNFIDNWIDEIRSMNAEKIMRIANTYFKKEDLFELVVGSEIK